MTTTIDRAGRIVIPKELREQTGLTPGTTVVVRSVHGHIEIEPVSDEPELVIVDGLPVFIYPPGSEPITAESVDAALKKMRDDRLRHINLEDPA